MKLQGLGTILTDTPLQNACCLPRKYFSMVCAGGFFEIRSAMIVFRLVRRLHLSTTRFGA